MFTIRPAVACDAPLLPAVEQSAGQAFRTIPELSWIADDEVQSIQRHLELMEKGVAWVAVANETKALVGFLNGQVVDGYLHIWEMSVDQKYQGKGIGRSLISTAKEHAIQKGYPGITLTTFRHVPWNDRFYASVGLVELSKEEITPAIHQILEDEVGDGLPRERRCAMRLVF